MYNNFSLGNRREAQVKKQMNIYNSIVNNQKMLANALKLNATRQHAAPAPAPAPAPDHFHLPAHLHLPVPVPAPVPAPVPDHFHLPAHLHLPVPVPAPAPVPAPVNLADTKVPKKNKFNSLLSKMNEQRKK